ncbi:hypothetical protein ACFQHO_34180 [Actinomadura yumaensis]|uniref:hypothetical protein n=1 Tax=Actinomadura yumaensis TaxID=111807 RepID=UPI0036097374
MPGRRPAGVRHPVRAGHERRLPRDGRRGPGGRPAGRRALRGRPPPRPQLHGRLLPAGGQTFLGGTPGRPGRVAVVSQSGGLAGEVVKVGERRGLAFSKVATVGNSADVTPAELLGHLAADPATSAIGLYLEDPRDGRGLFEALRNVRKPVVALVGGRSGQGREAAASHTGGMVSDTRVWAALAAQAGVALVTSQDDLIGVLDAFDLHSAARPPRPAAPRSWSSARAAAPACWPPTCSTARGSTSPPSPRPPERRCAASA